MRANLTAAVTGSLLLLTAISAAAPQSTNEEALKIVKDAIAAAEQAEAAAERAKAAALAARKIADELAAAAGMQQGRDTRTAASSKPGSDSTGADSSAAGAASKPADEKKVAAKEAAVSPISAFLTANSDSGSATIKYEVTRNVLEGGSLVHVLSLGAPVNPSTKSADFGTLDGLVSGGSIGYALSFFKLREHPSTDLWTGGVQWRLGYKKYKFYEPASIAEQAASHYSRSIAPYAGYNFGSLFGSEVLFQAKYDYQDGYKEGDARTLCPAATTAPVLCVTGPIGAPKSVNKRIVSLTTRFKNNRLNGEVLLSYDRVSKVKGIDMPLYFIQMKQGDWAYTPLSAGFRLGWRSDTKDVTAGIFVGSPFEMFGP